MWLTWFPYLKELILKERIRSLWEQILSFKRSSHFEKGRNCREPLLDTVVSLWCVLSGVDKSSRISQEHEILVLIKHLLENMPVMLVHKVATLLLSKAHNSGNIFQNYFKIHQVINSLSTCSTYIVTLVLLTRDSWPTDGNMDWTSCKQYAPLHVFKLGFKMIFVNKHPPLSQNLKYMFLVRYWAFETHEILQYSSCTYLN